MLHKKKKSIKQPRSTLHWPRVKTHPASTATSDTLVCHRLSLCNPLCLPQHHTTTRKEKSSNKTKPYSRLVAFAFFCAGVTLPRKQPYAGTDTHHVPQLTSSQAQTQKKEINYLQFCPTLTPRCRLRCHQEAHFGLCVAQEPCSTTKNKIQTHTAHNAQRKSLLYTRPKQKHKHQRTGSRLNPC